MQVTMGFSQGIMPLVSYTFASGNRKRMKEGILFALKVMVPVLLVITLAYYLGAERFIALLWQTPPLSRTGPLF